MVGLWREGRVSKWISTRSAVCDRRERRRVDWRWWGYEGGGNMKEDGDMKYNGYVKGYVKEWLRWRRKLTYRTTLRSPPRRIRPQPLLTPQKPQHKPLPRPRSLTRSRRRRRALALLNPLCIHSTRIRNLILRLQKRETSIVSFTGLRIRFLNYAVELLDGGEGYPAG